MKSPSGGDERAVSNLCMELKERYGSKYTLRHHFRGRGFEIVESDRIPEKLKRRKLRLEQEQVNCFRV